MRSASITKMLVRDAYRRCSLPQSKVVDPSHAGRVELTLASSTDDGFPKPTIIVRWAGDDVPKAPPAPDYRSWYGRLIAVTGRCGAHSPRSGRVEMWAIPRIAW